MLFIICAGSSAEARAWAKAHGIAARDMVYASSPSTVIGYPEFTSIRLPAFYARRDWQAIDTAVRDNDRRMAARAARSD